MIYIENNSLDPFFNLACEEYVLKNLNLNENIIMLWRDDNAIIVGKHQNTIEEINEEYVKENNIKVARRITGGGAVYHDLGNLNFSFILNDEKVSVHEMKKFAEPIVKALEKLGAHAEVNGRNDITIDGKKISGTAQAIHKNRILYHGTLLFDSNAEVISKSLKVKQNKIQSKGIKSVASRVTNIKNHLKGDIDVLEFKEMLKKYFFPDGLKEYVLSHEDLKAINKLREDKFSTWDFIYGSSPKFNYKNSQRFAGGEIEVFIYVKGGIITDCSVFGDFLGQSNEDINSCFIGKKYDYNEIKDILNSFPEGKLFGTISNEEVLKCFFK